MNKGSFPYKKIVLAISGVVAFHAHGHAQTTEETAAPSTLEAVVVSGKIPKVGDVQKELLPESRATLTKAELEKFVGIESPMTGALSYLPGVHFSGATGDGVTEGSLSIRGFSRDQIGFSRDGMPLNDPLYQVPYPAFFGDPENYESTTVTYGGAGINAPTLTASGAGVEIRTVAPTAESGLFLTQGFGSNNLQRTFARYNFGDHDGLSAWVSASQTKGDLWTSGGGEVDSKRFETNVQYKWGRNSINAIASYFIMRRNSYFMPTLAQYRGQDYKAGYPDPINVTYGGTNGVADVSTAYSNNTELQRADFKTQTYAINGVFQLTDKAKLRVDPYFIRAGDGAIPVYAAALPEGWINADLNGDGDLLDTRSVAGAITPTQYRIGNTARLDLDLTEHNTLQVGHWLDYVHAKDQFSVLPFRSDGRVVSVDGTGTVVDANGTPLYFRDQRSKSTTNKLWVQDQWQFAPQWNLKAGLAWQHTQLEGQNIAGLFTGNAYSREVSYHRFLPSLSLDYQLDSRNQLYYNSASNIRTPSIASLYEQNVTRKQQPETTWNQELGWRYSTDATLLKAALFYSQFKNRQVSYQVNQGVTNYFNAGKVHTSGLEFSVDGKLPNNFNYRAAYAYINAEQQSDYVAGGTVVNTKGKQVLNTPKNLLSAGIGYEAGRFYSNLLTRFTGSFYGDLANTEKIGSYTVVDLNLGYRLDLGTQFVKRSIVRVNFNNIFDRKHLSGVNGGSVTADASSALYGQPTYTRLAPRSIFASLSLDF